MLPLLVKISIGIIIFFVVNCLKIVKEYERLVIFRLGRLVGGRGPGPIFVLPIIEKAMKIDTRTITMDVPPQDVITRDNVSLKVNAVVYYRVVDCNRAINEIENYHYATSQLAQTTLRSVCGSAELDELLTNREVINDKIQEILDTQTDPWGIKVSLVELKHIDLPPEMQRAMARQAEAERDRRAKIINAEGEFQAAEKLNQAATIISAAPGALQLRYLQTLSEIATENNSTTIFPLPIELITPFLSKKSE